jgi:hypothetical protein
MAIAAAKAVISNDLADARGWSPRLVPQVAILSKAVRCIILLSARAGALVEERCHLPTPLDCAPCFEAPALTTPAA